jgi:recombination protein RecT
MATKSNENKTTVAQPNIVDIVTKRVADMENSKDLVLPDNYISGNALKSAWLILQNVEDRNKKKALEICSKSSIANSLFDMVVQGLNPVKKQCYFVVFGTELVLMRSYQGGIAVAKRVGMKEVNGQVIYKEDKYVSEIDASTGRKRLISHESPFKNRGTEIIGAYALPIMKDGQIDLIEMTMAEIKQAWMMGAAKGNSPAHTKFTDQMCIKTAKGRACKSIINSSDDAYLLEGKDDTDDLTTENGENKKRNVVAIGFDNIEDAEIVKEKPAGASNVQKKEPAKVNGQGSTTNEKPVDKVEDVNKETGEITEQGATTKKEDGPDFV